MAAFKDLGQLDGIGFKTILARGYWRSARITEDVIDALETSTPLAPMHNPAYIASIRAFQDLLPTMPLVAVFETWFHQTIPDYAAEFGVPRFWVEQHDIRRYGYHGASHRYISERVPQLLDANQEMDSALSRVISVAARLSALSETVNPLTPLWEHRRNTG